jgi:hypothetical protein
MEQFLHITNTTPSYLLAWACLCAIAVVGIALQALWILVLRPLFAWLGGL